MSTSCTLNDIRMGSFIHAIMYACVYGGVLLVWAIMYACVYGGVLLVWAIMYACVYGGVLLVWDLFRMGVVYTGVSYT